MSNHVDRRLQLDLVAQNKLPWIVDGVCKNNEEYICNLGYSCDGCPYNKCEESIGKEIQTAIVKVRCPTKGCTNYTYLEIPPDIYDTIMCTICGKTTKAEEWLS